MRNAAFALSFLLVASYASADTIKVCKCMELPKVADIVDPSYVEPPDEVQAEQKRLDDLWEPAFDPFYKVPHTLVCYLTAGPTSDIPGTKQPDFIGPDWRPLDFIYPKFEEPRRIPEPSFFFMLAFGILVVARRLR